MTSWRERWAGDFWLQQSSAYTAISHMNTQQGLTWVGGASSGSESKFTNIRTRVLKEPVEFWEKSLRRGSGSEVDEAKAEAAKNTVGWSRAQVGDTWGKLRAEGKASPVSFLIKIGNFNCIKTLLTGRYKTTVRWQLQIWTVGWGDHCALWKERQGQLYNTYKTVQRITYYKMNGRSQVESFWSAAVTWNSQPR